MAKKSVIIDRFNGGISSSKKEGIKGSYNFGRSIEGREESSAMTVLPRTVKDSGSTATGLIIDSVRIADGTTFFLDTAKKLYKRTAGGTWSVIGTISGDTSGGGMYYWAAKDTIYITTDNSVSTYGPVGNSPTLSSNKYASFIDKTASVTGGTSIPQAGNIQGRWKLDRTESALPQTASIQGHWDLDEASGNRSDSSGNSNTLTDNATVGASTERKEGTRSADFELSNSEYLSSTDNASLSITGDLTFSCWVKLESAPSNGSQVFVAKRKASGGDLFSYMFIYNDSSGTKTLQAFISSDGSSETSKSVTQTLTVGTWYHLTFVYDASAGEVDFYVDGSQVGATQTGLPTSIDDNASGFLIGASDSNNPGSFYDGLMDDAILWSAELTSAEVSGLYNNYYLVSGADSSGNGNTLNNNNKTTVDTDSKQEGNGSAIMESANSNNLSISDGSQTGLDITLDMTIACWVNIQDAPGTDTQYDIVSKYDATGDQSYIFGYRDASSTKQLFFTNSSDGSTDNTEVVAQTLTPGTDYHIAAVYDASAGEVTFYVDGAIVSTAQTGAPNSMHNGIADFVLGTSDDPPAASDYDGLLDDVIVWDFELTATDISDLYDSYTGGGATYTVGTAISENSDDKFSFVPANDPHSAIVLPVKATGAGDWTASVHDDSNNEVATVTVVNASLTANADNTFTFTTPWRPVLGATYHVHVISTAGSGTMSAGTGVIDLRANRLVDTKSTFHPVTEFLNFVAIANERYLTIYDGLKDAATDSDGTNTSAWTQHELTLPSGYEIVCMAQFDEFLVMGAEYGEDNNDDFSDGLLLFWDGTSEDYNFFIKVEEGGVQTLLPIKNKLYFIAGIRGELFETDGEDYVKVKRLPKTSDLTYMKTMFASSTIYRGVPAFGMAYVTDNATFEQGVYGYGAKDNIYPDVLTYDYPVSSGTRTATTLKIGLVRAYGSDMFIGWDDNGTYGVDVVNASSSPFTTATYESRLYDGGFPYVKKFVGVIRVDHAALAANETLQIGYDIDESGTFTTDTANSTDGSTETRFPVNAEFKTIQIQVNTTNTTTSPRLDSITLDVDDSSAQTTAV